jgi:hypothetical protein
MAGIRMSDENEIDPKNQDSTVAIVIGMLISILGSVYVLYISGTLGHWR